MLGCMPATGIEGFVADIERHRAYLAGRPVHARLLELMMPLLDGWLGELLAEAWSTRTFHAGYERLLVLLAALRFDALREGEAHPLYAGLVCRPAELAAITEDTLRSTLRSPRVAMALRERSPQTNETTRAVTWLWPAQLLARAGALEPIALCDLGASAGLNLIADALPADWTDATGAAIAVTPRPEIALRLGLDRSPIDARDPDGADWLRACVWPDDVERVSRLERGLAAFVASARSPDGPRVLRCALGEVAAPLSSLPGDRRALLMQSVVRDYLPPDELARYEGAVRALIVDRPACAVLWARFELCNDGEPPERSIGLSVTLRDAREGLRELLLARLHPHPRVLHVERAAVDTLLECLQARAPLT